MARGSDLRGVEIHDAQLLGVVVSSDTYVVQLDAFVLEDHENGNMSGAWQRVDLRFWKATVTMTGPYEARAHGGFTRVNGVERNHIVPIPFDESGEVVVFMTDGNLFSLEAKGERMLLELVGEPRNRESRR